ncbi:hypothetical protein KAR28_04055 [Candidatus Parcubacteria bacterium]|nr:hypothetical protein [Candidatus Parcubacteria bacterium]
MAKKLLKILWIVIILLFISLQIYNLIKANYADVITSLLTVVILLAMIIAYGLLVSVTKSKKTNSKEAIKEDNEN